MRAIRSCPCGAPAGRRIAGARRARACFLLVILPGLAAAPASAQVALGIGPLESAGVFREAVGVPKTVVCPAGDGSKASVYGTDVYTDGSPICAAAIHAGVLKPGVAGSVTLVAGTGADAFKGSERNGVTTRSYDRWPYSYSFVREPVPGTISWRTVWNYLPKEFDGPVELICPPGDPSSAPAWGTDVYTTETSICVAAVHAGIISPKEGGPVMVVRAPGQDSYAASEQNGVSSRAAGASADAFTVSGGALAGAGSAPGGTATLEPTGDVTSTLPTFGTTTTTAVTPSSQPASTVPPPSEPAGPAVAEPVEEPPLTAGTPPPPPPVPTCTSPAGTPAVCITLAGWTGTGAGHVPPPPAPEDPAMAAAPVPPLTVTLAGWTGEGAGYVAPPPAAAAPVPPLTITLPGWTGEGAGYVEETNDDEEN